MNDHCSHCCTRIEKLSVKYGDTYIIQDIDLHLNCTELLAVVGPNGAGKTTLLKAILGEIPFYGEMNYQTDGSSGKKPSIGYVPQKLYFDLDSPISVGDFVTMAINKRPLWLGISHINKSSIKKALSQFDAQHLIDKKIGQISGGEMQRVLLSIAMTPVPKLLLLDEPDAGVDRDGLSLFYRTISDIRKKCDISILMVTHDLEGIAPYADRMIVMNKKILIQGTPAEIVEKIDHV